LCKTKYDSETFPELAEGYARQGWIDEEIAKKLGISIPTYYDYQKKYVKFFEAIKKGKAPVDFEVEKKLLTRAMGYEYKETHTESYTDATGKPITKVKVIKRSMPPDVTAQIFWLKNRAPARWSDRHEHQLGGGIDVLVRYAGEKDGQD